MHTNLCVCVCVFVRECVRVTEHAVCVQSYLGSETGRWGVKKKLK